ncbi:SGNH/GDSL hydrolase family protein [Microbacterium sp. 2FI]|uniref:SGNH/GDSL hydrolase family protein n=1 Tax=Microbacterium sp. 2FI TaxID=2502193 RepID=UPI0014856CCE|nr:SGNH/GDSL hydrolase family protein [Microbacterium sp. 2FI]
MSGFAGAMSAAGASPRRRRQIALAVAGLLLAGGIVVAATIAAPPASAAGISVLAGKGGNGGGKGGGGGGGGGGTTEAAWGAIGDSFASGVGAGSYLDNTCYRSSKSYPSLLGSDTDKQLVSFLACSGADTAAVTSQAASLSTTLKTVTVTVGGNDVGFADVMQNCFVLPSSSCRSEIDAGAALAQSEGFRANLAGVITAVKLRAPNATVMVTGYPRLFWLNASGVNPKYAWADEVNLETSALNDVIEQVATANGATFVDVEPAFAGRGIGSSSPWINDWRWLSSTNSFHPNAAGYVAYAAAIRSALP